MNFKSDNIVGVSPSILEKIININMGSQNSYGGDEYSSQIKDVFSTIFEKQVEVFLTSTGTAANSLALSALVGPFDAIYCHSHAHINTDECNAPEFFTGGAKLIPIEGDHGKIDPNLLKESIEVSLALKPHTARPGCISLTQATECGTVYSLQELEEIKQIATEYQLPIHMDGARFTNALVSLGCTPAELTWKSGVDILTFGATKNGALAAEAVVFFNEKYAKDFEYRQKRSGQMMSKMRFFACQFLSFFENNLWIENATHANNMAQKLGYIFEKHGFHTQYPVQANEVFPILPLEIVENLREKGANFYEWGISGSNLYRFVTSCFTTDHDLESFKTALESSL